MAIRNSSENVSDTVGMENPPRTRDLVNPSYKLSTALHRYGTAGVFKIIFRTTQQRNSKKSYLVWEQPALPVDSGKEMHVNEAKKNEPVGIASTRYTANAHIVNSPSPPVTKNP